LANFSIRGRLWIRRFHFWLLVQTFLNELCRAPGNLILSNEFFIRVYPCASVAKLFLQGSYRE
ncbi:MAG: hypothetical protein Q8O58_04725, partial [Gallionella sp.]|nr:hypothetical protein [Gallionella sp.]